MKTYKIYSNVSLTDGLSWELSDIGYIKIFGATDNETYIQIQDGDKTNEKYPLYNKEAIRLNGKNSVFISAPAQAGKTISILTAIDFESFRVLDGPVDISTLDGGNTPSIYNKVMTVAATEYSQVLPTSCKRFVVRARGGNIQLSFTATESGTIFLTIPNGAAYSEDLILFTAGTLYLQSPTAGAVAEIIAWA